MTVDQLHSFVAVPKSLLLMCRGVQADTGADNGAGQGQGAKPNAADDQEDGKGQHEPPQHADEHPADEPHAAPAGLSLTRDMSSQPCLIASCQLYYALQLETLQRIFAFQLCLP